MHYIIIGASRGLGAALVGACLADTSSSVTGVGRSRPEDLPAYAAWMASGRFNYLSADITGQSGREQLRRLCAGLPGERVCIIFNAAVIESDMDDEGNFSYAVYDRVSRITVTGFGVVLDVFGNHLRTHRGTLVGISSLSAWVPPFLDKRAAYPASKAFLTMALRSLRVAWANEVNITTVFLGHIGDARFGGAPEWFIPSYDSVARGIIARVASGCLPEKIVAPWLVCRTYQVLQLFPDAFAAWAFKRTKWLFGKILGRSLH